MGQLQRIARPRGTAAPEHLGLFAQKDYQFLADCCAIANLSTLCPSILPILTSAEPDCRLARSERQSIDGFLLDIPMADTLTPAQRSERMSRIRSRDTKPEMVVRRLAHGLGYRYRLHRKDLPGKPDLVFPRRRAIIFIHGCFWHRHDCKLGRLPKSRHDFWIPKLEANRLRDRENMDRLEAEGWRVLVVWECQLRDLDALTERLRAFLGRTDGCDRSSCLPAPEALASE